MGAVYRARDLHFPNVMKVVAVKEMVNRARDEVIRQTIVRNFEREANLLATLNHRAIPRIYDYFTHNERSYLILEYIDGKDLEAIIDETPDFLPQETVVQWALELCDVLHYLHSHEPDPIIFRDMKPSNVMVNQHGHIILIDFGIAKPFETGQKGTMIGTEGYSPPEQYRGEASHLADIYALGATLHHLLTRHDPRLEAPFSFNDRPIRQLNPAVSPQLEAVIFKALAYEPEDRYQSAAEMKAALYKSAKQTGVLSKIPQRASVIGSSKEINEPVWVFTTEDEIRGTPTVYDGKLYCGSYDNNLYALDASKGDFIWKYPAEGGIVCRPTAFENNIYFGSEDHRLHVVNAQFGRLNWTYTTEGPIRSSPHIAEGHAFIGSDDGYLHAVNLVSGRLTWRVDVGARIRSSALVANEHIYFGTETGDFYCLDFGSSVRWRFKAKRAVTSSPVHADGIIYFGSVDATLYAIDAKTGWVVWRFRLGKPTISTPYIYKDWIFIGVDRKSAKELWAFETENQVTGSPIVHQDSVYCGSVDGSFYCLELRTGRLRWKHQTGGPITGTPFAQDEMVYIGSTDKCIYAFLV